MKRIPFYPSPHYSSRPEGLAVDMIVLHAISLPDGIFGMQHVTDLFMGTLDTQEHTDFVELQGVQVSAHFVVARNGQVSQFVATNQRAWHAGVSSWQGRDDCNDYAIGIEMIGDERQPFTAQQYTETARLCRMLSTYYPQISKNRIVGHQDIAPTRKWDPGKQWDWSHFQRSFSHIKKLDINFQA
ncbi:MAG: 1,6-anhydro-N-acetylmuramyl-L-alanine amidase AmpD [Ghiorsea sp.]